MKKTILSIALLYLITACSSDDSSTVDNGPQPQPKSEIIDWISGNATEYGLNLGNDQFTLTDNSFVTLDMDLHIIPKPGYEDIPYTISAKYYGLDPSGTVVYTHDATGEFTGVIDASPHGKYTLHLYMTDKMEYDAELTMKPQNLVNPLPQKSATGRERQD